MPVRNWTHMDLRDFCFLVVDRRLNLEVEANVKPRQSENRTLSFLCFKQTIKLHTLPCDVPQLGFKPTSQRWLSASLTTGPSSKLINSKNQRDRRSDWSRRIFTFINLQRNKDTDWNIFTLKQIQINKMANSNSSLCEITDCIKIMDVLKPWVWHLHTGEVFLLQEPPFWQKPINLNPNHDFFPDLNQEIPFW